MTKRWRDANAARETRATKTSGSVGLRLASEAQLLRKAFQQLFSAGIHHSLRETTRGSLQKY